jgi:hypothetical protein
MGEKPSTRSAHHALERTTRPLPSQRWRGGKMRPLISWPVALRRVRSWLEPWVLLGRWWRAWSTQPPPPALQALLDWLWRGQAIPLYDSS